MVTTPEVILLGHTGVIGSAIASYLRSSSIPFTGVDRASYAAARGTHCDVLINAAGSSDRRAAAADPLTDFEENVAATLRAVFDIRAEHYIHLSSVAVYARVWDEGHTSEAEPIDPLALDPYGYDKALAEVVVRRYARRWAILRLGPIVGPELRKNAVYDLVHRRRLFIHPASRLPYIHTRELARIAWELRRVENEVVNVTGDGSIGLHEVAEMVGVPLAAEWSGQPMEDFAIDIRKLKRLTHVPPTRASIEAYLVEAGTTRAVGSGMTNPPA